MMKLFMTARQVSVPIVVIRTADQQATTQDIQAGIGPKWPVVTWDAARGILPTFNDLGQPQEAAVAALAKYKIVPDETVDFVQAMTAIGRLPKGSIAVIHNAHRQLTASEPLAIAPSVQAVANLRPELKKDFRMIVLLAPSFVAPAELEQDIVVLDHELPGAEELAKVIKELHVAAKLPEPSAELLARAVEAVSGLSKFAAEQVVAMSLNAETGLDIDSLWERKRVAIEQTRGLRVWRGHERFADIVGQDAVKTALNEEIAADTPLGVVVWIDEIDKVFANVEHDTSNVRMDQLRTFLTDMENYEWRGMVLMGVAGGGKSLLAKAFGNEAGVPTISVDFGDMEGPHVGESEMMLRHAMDVIRRVGSGNAFVIATSNNASVMRPEMQRRFTEGMFFFDVMSDEERAKTWAFYLKKYGLSKQTVPNDDGWTGAEIRNCCRRAKRTRKPLLQAAKFIVPMAQSRGPEIDELRKYANGRFLDANNEGSYKYDPKPMRAMIRAIDLPAAVVETLVGGMKES